MTSTSDPETVTYWRAVNDDAYIDPHRVVDPEIEFVVHRDHSPDGDGCLTTAVVLERALYLADVLGEAGVEPIVPKAARTLPVLSVESVQLTFGDRTMNALEYSRERPNDWPRRPDGITVHTLLEHPDRTTERKVYDTDIAFVQDAGDDRPVGNPLALVSAGSRLDVEHLADILTIAYGGPKPSGRELDEAGKAARVMAMIALLGLEARLTAVEELNANEVAAFIPAPARQHGRVTVELFRDRDRRAEAWDADPNPHTGQAGHRADRANRERRNRHRYQNTAFSGHPGIEHGWIVPLGNDHRDDILSVRGGEILLELGTGVRGRLFLLPPEPGRTATHAVVWTTEQGPDGPTAVHLLSDDDADTLRDRSTGLQVERLITDRESADIRGSIPADPDPVELLIREHHRRPPSHRDRAGTKP